MTCKFSAFLMRSNLGVYCVEISQRSSKEFQRLFWHFITTAVFYTNMAEAQPAVAFQFIVTPEGLHFKIDNDALTAVFLSGLRSWQKSLIWLHRRIVTGVYPATWASWILAFFIILALQFADLPFAYQINRTISSYFR